MDTKMTNSKPEPQALRYSVPARYAKRSLTRIFHSLYHLGSYSSGYFTYLIRCSLRLILYQSSPDRKPL